MMAAVLSHCNTNRFPFVQLSMAMQLNISRIQNVVSMYGSARRAVTNSTSNERETSEQCGKKHEWDNGRTKRNGRNAYCLDESDDPEPEPDGSREI